MTRCLLVAVLGLACAGTEGEEGSAPSSAPEPGPPAEQKGPSQADPPAEPVPEGHEVFVVGPAGVPLANTEVRVWSDNGVRCIAPPCPTEGREQLATTDDAGRFVLPPSQVDQSMTLLIEGYRGQSFPAERPLPAKLILGVEPEG